MSKVRKSGHRGTEVHEVEIKPQNWAGDAYRKEELNKISKVPKGITMHVGRGIRTVKAGDLPNPRNRPSTEGMTRVTNRGTGSRKSQNKGTQ